MEIGIPKETKDNEFRVGATPSMVRTLVVAGHCVLVETQAGSAIDFTDQLYEAAGAKIVSSPKEVYQAEMIIKVKEPQPSEYPLLKEGQILFCYLHLAPDPKQTAALLERKVVGIAFETVTDRQGRLPLLTPMSEIAGRISIQAGASALQMVHGGRGVLLGGVPGVFPGKVIVLGGGVVGTQAARMAIGLGADTTILDNNPQRLRELDDHFNGKLKTLYSTPSSVEEVAIGADLVVGAVLIPGKVAPKLVTEELIKKMKKGSVVIDVAIDQGGCFETSRPTTHSKPTFICHEVVHYCVANMPGACARTATMALTNSIFPYAMTLACLGYKKALLEDHNFLPGLNVFFGKVTNEYVANDLNYDYYDPQELLRD